MAKKKNRVPPKKKHSSNGQIPFTPPQSELDSNIRAVLMHIVHHYRTITVPITPLDPDDSLSWTIGQTPSGSTEITVWWGKLEEGQEGGE